MKPIEPVYFIGVLFSPFAALAAFLIFYDEYSHHFPDRKEPLKIALEAAAFTFVVFVILGVLVGLALSQFL